MKIVIISDIHANADALWALPEAYDELWVLGDLVNYGPEPDQVIEFVRSKASVVIRGNHDHAVGFQEDPRCSPRFRAMAESTRRYTDSVLGFEHKQYLQSLPVSIETQRQETKFYLCHAIPSDPLYGYCEVGSPRWRREAEKIGTDVILAGHTHVPAVNSLGSCVVVNPGSLGQPKTRSPEARYAVWEDGKIELKSYRYPLEDTVVKIQALPIEAGLREELIGILRTGQIPQAKGK